MQSPYKQPLAAQIRGSPECRFAGCLDPQGKVLVGKYSPGQKVPFLMNPSVLFT